MGLTFTGRREDWANGDVKLEGKTDEGRIVITLTQQALSAYGMAACKAAAIKKFSREVDANGCVTVGVDDIGARKWRPA